MRGALPPACQRDLDDLRAFVRRAIGDGNPAPAVPVADVREVLLTGATGFVGRFVLRDLLCPEGDLVVHCLVRANDGEHGLQRLRAAMEEAEIWDEAFADRIRVVVGDLCEARFGLGPDRFDDLARRIDAVHHFAAEISLSTSYQAIRKTNASGMRNVLELCLRTRRKHLFHASTMGVFPQYFCDFANEFAGRGIEHQGQPDLAEMKRMFPLSLGGYSWSKLVAEQSVLFAHQAGLPAAVFRLPLTSRSTTGYIQPSDTSVRVYAAVADVEMMPGGFSFQRQNHTVDTLSRICTAIASNPRRQFTLYHCCNANPVPHDIELADFGHYLREVPHDTFMRACQARGEESPLHGYWALFEKFAPYWFSPSKALTDLPVSVRALREDCPFPIEWPGILTMFRRTNEWIREHREQWPFSLPQSRIDYDRLLTRARHYAERFGAPFAETYPEWIRDGLARLVEALQAPEARLLQAKRAVVVSDLSASLRNNAMLTGERMRHPAIARERSCARCSSSASTAPGPRSCTGCWRAIRDSGPCTVTSWRSRWWWTATTPGRGPTPTSGAPGCGTCSSRPASSSRSRARITSTSMSPRRTSPSCGTPSGPGPTPTSTWCPNMDAGWPRRVRSLPMDTTAAPCSTSPGSGTCGNPGRRRSGC